MTLSEPLKFSIDIRPKAKQSTRLGKYVCHTSPDVTAHQNQVKWHLKSIYRGTKLINQPCAVEVNAFFKIPKDVSKKNYEGYLGAPYPKIPDGDNLLKMYCDCLKGVVIENDELFTKMTIDKKYSAKDLVEITITPL